MIQYGLFILLMLSCTINKNLQIPEIKLNFQTKEFSEVLKDEFFISKIQTKERNKLITSIILHNTNNKALDRYLKDSLYSNFLVHLIISKQGILYGFKNPEKFEIRAVPALDETSIHIAVEGVEEDILKNKKQLNKLNSTIKIISDTYNIPLSNKYINSKSGIFTHTQAKKKFGNFVNLEECGGEKIIKEILLSNNGNFTTEEDWYGRFEKDWILRKEKKTDAKHIVEYNRGRGITIQPNIELENLEKDITFSTPESYRLKYNFKQRIIPTCIVLHYTAIPTFQSSLETLEKRNLSATIMVDKNGKAYQLIDYLDEQAQAASGTNHRCIQIEIVGKNTEELISNIPQSAKVASLVKELSKKFNIPLSNYKIEELKGVYSHSQAKKKWGGSVAMYGKDFDPGEAYMKKIFQYTEGKYFEEKDWFGRKSDDWAILHFDFQP